MELKPLEEHNKARLDAFWPDESGPRPNGIACPECGEELFDSNPYRCLASSPPQYATHCSNCGYLGSRY